MSEHSGVPDPEQAGHIALDQWLRTRAEFDSGLAPSTLWHYTDAGGLAGIVRSNRLWATNARFMNDSGELAYGMELARSTLESIDLRGRSDETRRFVEGLADNERRVIDRFLKRTLDVYVACFCEEGDLLSQWRGYSGVSAGGGYAIGFRPPGNALAWPQAAGSHGLWLRRVLYNPQDQRDALTSLIMPLIELLDQRPDDVSFQNTFARFFVDGLADAVAWCKHPAFAEEREWRVIYIRMIDREPLPVQHRAVSSVVVPYVEFDLRSAVGAYPEQLPINCVVCGPSADSDLKRRGVESLVLATPHLRDRVQVATSRAPLRS